MPERNRTKWSGTPLQLATIARGRAYSCLCLLDITLGEGLSWPLEIDAVELWAVDGGSMDCKKIDKKNRKRSQDRSKTKISLASPHN